METTVSPPFLPSFKRHFKLTLLFFFLALLVSLPVRYFFPLPLPLSPISFHEVTKIVDGKDSNAVLIDARSPSEFAAGHIPHALNLPIDQFDTFYPKLAPRLFQKRLVTYCSSQTCPNAQKLSLKLQSKGHRFIQTYIGGMEEWDAAGRALEKR